jgi:hypothetical protein
MTNKTIDVKTTHNTDILCQEFDAALTRFWRRTNRLHRDRKIAFIIIVELKLEKRKISRKRHNDEKKKSKKSWKIVKILKTKNRSEINERFTRKRYLRKKNKKKKRFLCWDEFIAHLRSVYDSLSHSFSKIYNISHSWKTIVFDEF